MARIRKEPEIVKSVTRFLNDQNYNVYFEVPTMGQSADIVALKGRWLTIIEAKVHDWKRGLEQCKAHEYVADYIGIAICTISIPTPLMEDASINGYGIIHCSPKSMECEWVTRPTINRKVWKPQRLLMLKQMRLIKNGN